MREDTDLDRLIDAALSTYADADSNLEQRVLARISLKPAPPRRRWLAGAVALPAVACLLLFILLFGSKPHHAPSGEISRTAGSGQPHAAMPRVAPPKSFSGRPARQPKPASAQLPKRDIFPTPQPLSAAERALVEFATYAPEAERKSFVEAQKQLDEPIKMANIQIDTIRIPPLEPPQPGAN